MNQTPGTELPDDALIAVYGSEWKYDEDVRELGNGEIAIPAEMVYTRDDLRMFRPGRATP
jgi:hypothetical protein